MSAAPVNLHATAIRIGEEGILIRGAARSGKSTLAFALLRRARLLGIEARLVADDQVLLAVEDGRLLARVPPTIAGLIEISGVGILEEPHEPAVAPTFLIQLTEREAVPRLPDSPTEDLMGHRLRRIVLPAREAALGADILQGLLMERMQRR